ncbi:MAG: sulfatase-like hydrolase/transferase [Polyangiales bacterium]
MTRARSALALSLVLAACPRRERPSRPAPAVASPSSPTRGATSTPATPGVMPLDDLFRQGVIDTAGPVVDLGERQSAAFVVGPNPDVDEVNGDTWINAPARLRLRVPLGTGRAPDDAPAPPTSVSFRVRRAAGRGVSIIVDGLLVRRARLPSDAGPSVASFTVPSDRFSRSVADVELRIGGARGAPPAQVDWVHVASGDAPPALVNTLTNDVAVEPTPRRALTFFPPTVLAASLVLPRGATWRASLAAEAPRGGSRPPAPVIARLRAEADGVPDVERRVTVRPNRPWTDVALDLTPLGGRPARLSITATENTEARLAVAAPRLEHPAGAAPPPPAGELRHVVVVVLRGARADRFFPSLSSRLAGGGFARMLREGTGAEATAPSLRSWSSLISATSGLPAETHRVVELTDLLDEEAPTLASTLVEAGVRVRCFSDDPTWFGSGADRGCGQRVGCEDHPGACRADTILQSLATAGLEPTSPTASIVVLRGGALPLDPSNDDILALDPQPYEGTVTPAQTAVLAQRGRRGDVRLEAAAQDRLGLLHDAVLLGVDRALGALLDRVEELGASPRTLVIVTGDRGTPLGEARAVGDGPLSLRVVSSVPVMARGAGFAAGATIAGAVGVIDVAATVLERLGVPVPEAMTGVSLARSQAFHDRVLPVVATTRGEMGLRFADLIALPRPAALGGGMQLIDPREDPLGQSDLALRLPIARALAEFGVATLRPTSATTYRPSTRVVPGT